MRVFNLLTILALAVGAASAASAADSAESPVKATEPFPETRWQGAAPQASRWTAAALAALRDHARPLVDMVPADTDVWCPAYPGADADRRRAFWVGFVSALSKHESTYNPRAVGGNGRWFGLLQIAPATARGYDCRATSTTALRDGAANLSCALRIMAKTVPRDGVISAGMRGVAADWGPLHNTRKREDMRVWLRRQSYCRPPDDARADPALKRRPSDIGEASRG